MKVVAGDRAVHIHMTYDQAEWLLSKLTPGDELYAKLATELPSARAKGRPLPPLPKSK